MPIHSAQPLQVIPRSGLLAVWTLVAVFVCVLSPAAWGQATTQSTGSFDFNSDGMVFQTLDTNTRIIMRFRMQNWAVFNFSDEGEISSTDLAVRRLRLRFGGHVVDKRLTFNLQVNFSRSDLDYNDTQFPNVIRDAMVFWSFNPNLQVSFGQTKLPGNRQRVVSSGDQFFPDRSIVNGAFNLDRDFGFQGFGRFTVADAIVNVRGAVSSGDGRNQAPISGDGLAYTGRVEVLPFGAFTNGGDYFEGDLLHEAKPKVSLALTLHHNDRMNRTRGELGPALYAPRSADVAYADVLAKWNGWAFYGEWAQRTAKDPVTIDRADTTKARSVFVGHGYMGQLTYNFPWKLGIGARYSVTEGESSIARTNEYVRQEQGSLVGVWFANGHRVRFQIEGGFTRTTDLSKPNPVGIMSYFARLNSEFGI